LLTLAMLATLACLTMHAPAQTVALTFDDGLDPATQPQAAQWNRAILRTLGKHGIRAMLFPSLSKVGGDAGRALVADWSHAGHDIGNHTSAHRNLNSPRLSAQEFIAHVREDEDAFGSLPGWRRMLRFPYLKEGDTAAKRDAVRDWMAGFGYRGAPVSIDTSDWYFAQVLAKLPAAKHAALRDAYVAHLLDRAAYYDALAQSVLGRRPPHVMLLHTNGINAAFLEDVIRAFVGAGWTFVSAAQAFDDPLYSQLPTALPAGESIVWALAREQGRTDLRYPAEDAPYEEPALRAKGLLPAR
jgi:peptidoglycan/xylan/chitin deacetylase (PgdA/CDA1 family)